jgi:hypothetical protein
LVVTLVFGAATPVLGGTPPSKAAFDPAVARRIEVADVQRRVAAGEKVVLLDSRGSIHGTMLKGAVHVPAGELETWAKTVAPDTLIVTYCA